MRARSGFRQFNSINRFAVIATVVLLAAGCGDGGSDESDSSSQAPGGGASLSISGSPSSQILVGQSFSFRPSVNNPSGATLSFTATNLPSWASINASTGRITGNPGAGHVGTYTGIRVTVSGGGESATTPAFTVEVVATTIGSATLSWQPPTENTDGSPLTDLAGYNIYWGMSPSNFSNSVRLNNPGLTTYMVEQLTPATWYFSITAFDTEGLESNLSNIAAKTIR